jgi:hypothetical protein
MAAAVTDKGHIGAAGKKAEGTAAAISDKYAKKGKAPPTKNPQDHAALLREELLNAEGPGATPDSALKQKLGPIGGDPADARLHTGPAAAAAAQALQANAFTIGSDIFFGAGKFDPHTAPGVGLVAHEATHVLQQKGKKGDKARFDSQRGGDEMEQEAQEAAQLVLTNLGRGETLIVSEYVRNYSTAEGGPLTPADRSRLDHISLLALKQAQKELRRKGVHDVPTTRELTVDVSIELSEMSDQEAAQAWCDEIVKSVAALQIPESAHRSAIQRDPTPAPVAPPPGANPTGPDDPDTLQVKLFDPRSGLNAPFTMRHFSGVMEADLRALGVAQVRLLVAVQEGAPDIPNDGPDSNHYGSNKIWLQADPYADTGKRFYRKVPQFKAVAAKLAQERKDFLAEFVDKGAKVMLALVAESRARVNETFTKYGIAKKKNTQSSNATTSYSSSNNSLDELVKIAATLVPKRQRLERMMESAENLKSKLHLAFASASKISREEEDAKNLPEAKAEWDRDFAAAREKFPIISHYESASGLEGLATGPSIVKNIGTTLDRMLTNLDDLEQRLKDPTTIYKLGQGFEGVKKSYKPELTELQLAYVNMDAADRQKAEEDLKLYLSLFTVVLGAMTGGLGGFALLAAEAVVAGISTYQLLQQISDFQLQSAASMSDPELAQCLSASEPSLGWLVFDIVSSVVGLRANIGRMRQAVDEIRNAYKLAQAYGEASKLEKALEAYNVPAATKAKIVNTIYHATTTIANFIRNPDPITAFGVINLFGSFWNLRTAFYKANAEPAAITKAKQTLQEARVKAVRAAIDGVKAKYPLVSVQIIDHGFDHPLHIVVTSTEIPISKVLMKAPEPPSGAGGTGTKIGSPAPDPNRQPSGTLKGVQPPASKPSGGTKKGMPPPPSQKSEPIPDGVYAITEKAGADPTKKSPSSLQGAPIDPTQKAGPSQAKTGPGGDPSQAKPPEGAGSQGKTPAGGAEDPTKKSPSSLQGAPDPALAKTDAAKSAPQLKAAVEDITNLGAQAPLAKATDLNILDPQAHEMTYPGIAYDEAKKEWVSDKSKAPVGAVPQEDEFGGNMDPNVARRAYMDAAHAAALAKLNKTEYQGQWIRLPEGRFKVVPNTLGGTSIKFIIEDTVTGQKYIFKPAAGEMPLDKWGHKAQGGTLFVRGAFAARLAQEMPAVEGVPMVTVVVHEGRVGSLQPFLEGTTTLEILEKGKTPNDQRLYQKVMNEDPAFTKWRNNLRAFDHIINNTDRDTNPGNIMIHEDPVTKKITYYAIDQDASLSPGAREVISPKLTLRPRTNLADSWTDPANPVMGKISKSLFDQMQAMIRNENSVRIEWKKAYGLNDAAVDGVMGRMREVVADYTDRANKSKDNLGAVFFMD